MRKFLTILLVLFMFLIMPMVSTGAIWAAGVGLRPGAAIVFPSNAASIDRYMGAAFHSIFGNRVMVSDGTNDELDVRAALATITTGGDLILSSGNFTWSENVTYTPATNGKVRLIGYGAGISYNGSGSALVINTNNTSWSGGVFFTGLGFLLQNTTANADVGIDVIDHMGLHLEDISVIGFQNAGVTAKGIRMTNTVGNCELSYFRHLKIAENNWGITAYQGTNTSFQGASWDNIIISAGTDASVGVVLDGWFGGSVFSGIAMHDGGYDNVKGWYISQNTIGSFVIDNPTLDFGYGGLLGIGFQFVGTDATDPPIIIRNPVFLGTFANIATTGGQRYYFQGFVPGVSISTVDTTIGQYFSIAYSGNVTVDWNNGNVQYIQLVSGAQALTMSNPQSGGRYVLYLDQPSSGAAGTLSSWPLNVYFSTDNTTPTLCSTNNSTDAFAISYRGDKAMYFINQAAFGS